MSIVPTGNWAPITTAGRPDPSTCPNCNSSEWKAASLVHLEGLSASAVRTRGKAIGLGASGRLGVGVAGYQGRSFGFSQTALSKMAAPPRQRHGLKIFLVCFLLFCLLAAFNGLVNGDVPALLVCGGTIALLLLGISRLSARQNRLFQAAAERYEALRVCQRCGTFYHA